MLPILQSNPDLQSFPGPININSHTSYFRERKRLRMITGAHLKSGQHFKVTFLHTTAHRKTIVMSFLTSFKMHSTYQILRQSFEMIGSYRTIREPSRDWKFAKSSIFSQKEAGASLTCVDESYFTCLGTPGSNSRKCWFLSRTYQ